MMGNKSPEDKGYLGERGEQAPTANGLKRPVMGRIPKSHMIVVVVMACIPVGLMLGLYLWFSQDLPSTDDLVSVRPWTRTVLYDVHGVPIKSFYEQDRVIVALDEIPQNLTDAFIATEDRKFYRHWGLNILAIGKAIFEDVVARSIVRGASTITQQLARNLFLTQEQTITRKIKEAILAIRIERHYTKEEILTMYLNQIYFGDGAYGVEAAARRFFGKPVGELTLAECSILAGLPRNPGAYSPRRHLERARQRQAIVLASMIEMDMITAEVAAVAKNDTLRIMQGEVAEVGAYFTEHIRRMLEDKYGASALYRDGLKVHTTLDLTLQEAAEKAVETNLRAMEKRLGYEARDTTGAVTTTGEGTRTDYIQAALVAIDPETGHVKAMVGGRDYIDSNFNRATQALRQPGSAFKIFVYAAAIASGLTPADIVMDDPIVVDMPDSTQWRPKNFTETFAGPVTLRHALAKSINIPAIKVAERIGQGTVIHYARKMGITSPLKPYMSIALGSFEVTLLELVSAVGVLATSGIRAEPVVITRIESRDGRILERHLPRKSEAISAQTAYVVNSMLQSVVREGTGQAIKWRGITRTLAGKTGTTDDYTDAWFVGFSPDLAVGVWSGFDEKRSMGERETGARVSLPIWIDFVTAALAEVPDRPFSEPHGIVRREICTETGFLATSHCPTRRSEVFVSGTETLRFCDLHRTGRLLLDLEESVH
jgi:penicillin-binding protein 1A